MTTGVVDSPMHWALLVGLNSATTNNAAMPYVLGLPPQRDVGFVAADTKFVAYLWNGTLNNVSISSSTTSGDPGVVCDLVVPAAVYAKTSQKLIITAQETGPIAFTTLLTFVSNCYGGSTLGLTVTGTRPLIVATQPRPIDLSTAMEEAYAATDMTYTIYDTLEFASSGAGDTVRVVYSDEDLPTPEGLFSPCKFDCTLPETEGAVRGQMQISVEFLPKAAQVWLRQASQARGKITVKWRQYLAPNAPPDAEYPIPLEVVSVEQNPNGVTATALFPDLINMPFPRRTMTTKVLPGGII